MEYFVNEADLLAHSFEVAMDYQEVLYHGILKLVFGFCPLDLLGSLLGKSNENGSRTQIERLVSKEILKYPELDFEMDTKFLANSLAKTQATNEKTSISHKISLIMVSKGILTFILYFDGQYLESFKGFRWCLQFIYYVHRTVLDTHIIQDLLDDCERMFSLLCARSLIMDFKRNGNPLSGEYTQSSKVGEASILQGLLFNVMDCTDPSMICSKTPMDTFVLSKFFETLGEIEEHISIFNGSLAQYTYNDQSYDLALRVQRSSVNEMIRKYILAATMALDGDPMAVHCSDKILEGIILYGGIHIDILRFFHVLKSFYYTLHARHIKLYQETVLTRECVSMANNIMEEWDTIESHCDPKETQLPQVLLRTMQGSILMVDEVFEESQNEHRHEISLLLSSIKLKAKRKWHGELHTESNYSNSLRKLGIEWITLWEQSFSDNNGDLPTDMSKMAFDIKQWPTYNEENH